MSDDLLLHSVRGLIERTGMLAPGASVVLGVSGGQDSCALLLALVALRDEMRLTLHAAHLNHGFRGAEADADAEFTRALADSRDVPCVVETQDVPAQARRLHLSAQEAARRARHRFLERVADAVGADRIALGHTRDDRIETVLLNILRGTGPDGLRGIAPVSDRRIRPLLEVSREETAACCRRHGIAFRVDASNRSLRYARNRVREELLPMLASYYNPEVREALRRLSDLASEEAAYMDALARDALARFRRNGPEGRVVFSAGDLAATPRALQRRILRLAVAGVRGGLVDVEFSAVERVMDALHEAARTGRRQVFALPPGAVYIRVDAGEVAVYRRAAQSARPVERLLSVPGETAAPEWDAVFHAAWSDAPLDPIMERGARRAWIAADAVRLPLVVRSWRPGDRFQPLGAPGSRKVQDLFTDRKVPVEERGRTPLVADADGILWVVGHAIAERARVQPETRRALCLEMRNIGTDRESG